LLKRFGKIILKNHHRYSLTILINPL